LPTAPGVAGPDIRQGDYMDTQVAGYEVSSDDGRFKQVRPTIASAESLISSAQEGRQNTVEKLTGELEKTQATIESNREKLNELDQIGEQDSAGYKKIESNTKNLVSKVSRLNEKIQSVSQPLQIKAKQEKKSRKGFTLFEGGKPVGTYPTQEDAEIAAVAFRTDEELDGIINAAPKAQLEGALEQPFGEQPVQVGTVRGGMPRRLYDEAVKEKDRRYRSQAGLPPPAAPVKIKITGDAQAAAERLRASGITVRFMPEVEKEIPEINKRLRAVLDKLGLKDIRLNIVNSLKAPGYVIYGQDGKPVAMFLQVPPGSPEYAKTMATIAQARAQGLRVEEDVFSANGSYAAKLIEIALDSKNPIRAARHEAIHALKELGFFTPQQWAVLERKAKSEWLKKYNIEGSGYGSLSKEGQIEEAIADAFSDFDQETPPTGQIGILFNKVKKFFEALGNAFRGSGFQTASDVFTLVEEGRLTGPGDTGVTGTEATRYSVAPLSKGEVDALSASGPNSALIIDAYNRWAQAFSKLPSDIKNKLDALYVANRKTKLTAQDPGYSDRGARAAETRTFKAASQALEKHLGKELNPDELSLYLTDWRGSVDERLEKPPSFERNKYSLSQIPRVMSTGKIVGAPPGKNTEADRELLINEMVQLLEDPFTMFNESRFWYENSGKTIREMTRSDPELMERVVRLLSLYSQANSLGGNTTATIKSISQLAQGAPTALAGRFPNETAKRIPAILSAPTMDSTLPGVDDKLMNFYRNLRDATFQDDTFSDASTVDRWMMRLFGYPHAEDQEIGGATGVSNTQYVYAKDLLKKIADIESERTGEAILPRQIQAALWTYVRNKTEFDSLPPEKQATFEPKNVDFADYVTRATVNITWESRPSTKINLIPGIHKASRRSQEEFNRAVREIFVDPTTGEDKIFKLLDNQQLYSSEFSVGAYENRVVPNVITRLVLQKDNGEYLTSVADNYAAIVGYVTKQDAVPWYRADPTATGKDASVGYRVTPSIASTIDFENKLFEHLNNKIPGIGFTRIGGSFDFVNFRDADTGKPFAMPDKKYIEKLQDALKTFAPDVNFNVVPFRAKSGWISNNWEENADGQGYLDRLRKAGLGDLQRVIDGWSETYGEIANDFGKEFGWARLSLKSNESIGGPSIGSGISIRPQQPTAQSFDAVHYGKQRVETLFGSMYGTGIKGAEAQRVFNSDDPRVRQRAYFYIPFNNGRMPKPEAGLGQEVHVQRLNNLLGPGPEMQGLASASRTPDGQFDENAFESSVIDAGYDGYAVPNMGMAVVLGSDVPVVSRGTRQEVEAKPDKDKIQIGNRKYSLRQTNTKEFKDWFGDSKIVNGDSTPKVMYHGLAKDTTDFTRKTERGAPIFLTDDPTFAPRFAADSYASVARNPEPYLTKEQIDGGVKRAIAAIKKDYGKDSLGKEMIESLKTGNLKDATPEAREYIQKEFINLLPTGPHIMPLYVRAERSFDYDNPEHIERVINNLKDSNINTELLSYDLNKGDWETIESPRVQEAIKELGFDSFYVEEIGRKNLAVYEPNQVKSAIGNLGTFSRTNNDIRYSLALEGLKPSSALIPDEGGNPSGNLGFMPEKLGGKPIRLLVGTHNDLVDELVNEKMYRPVSYGGNHILNRIMSYPRREPIGAEELLEKIARAAQKTSQTYTRIYKDGKRFILFDGKNSLILGENPDSMSIITMYTQTDPNRRYGNPAWFGRAPVVPEFVGAIRGTKVEAKEGRIAPSEVDTKAKRVYTPSEVGAIAAGEPQKGTITLKKLPKEKFSLALPKEVSKEFFDGSKYLPESTSVEQIRDDWIYRFNKEIYDPSGNPTGRTGMTQAYVLSDVVGGPEYIEALQDYVRENLGESFKGYRLMSIDEFEELETGSIGSQLVSYTLDPDFALLFANVARKRKFEKGERVVVEFDITPEHVQMIGSPGESELVIDYGIGYDPSKINAYASPVKFSLAGQKPVEPEFKMPPFARLRPETSEDIDKIYDYLEERAKKSGYKIETGSSNISGSRYLTIVEELPDDDVRSIELRVSNHGDRYSHTYADEKISIDPSRGGVDLEDALYQLQEKGYNLIEPQAIAPKGEPTKEPTKGTISLGKKLSLRVPDTAAVKKFLQGSPASFDFETGDPLVFFRGQRRDAGPESFDIKTRATPSFTTNPHVASVYASRGLDTLPGEVESDWVYTDGSFLMPSFIQMKAAIDLRGYGNRPAILIDLFNDSGVDPAVFEDAPQDLMDVLDELAQLQYSTGFQSGGAFESVEDALDAFRKDISKIDPDSLESRTEDAQEIIGNTVYGVLENLRIDPFAFADSQKVLDLVKQYYPKADAFIVRDVMSETLAEKLAEKGQIDDDSGYDTYKPFEVNQVKSIFNFNPDIKKKDVRYSLAGAANLQSFGLAPTDAKDNAIFLLQDKNIDLKRIIEGIRKNGKILSEDYDAYRKEELFHGRSATLIKFFLDRELRPLLQKMQNANISLEQMDDYLLARHAKEANAYIRKVNPDKSQNSGMTDKEADDFMKALPTSRRNALDSISRDIDAITKKTREIMVDTGLESQNTVNQWEKTYKNYVPLFREEIEDGRPISLGRGFDIRGSTTRQRMGSSRKVVDVLANIAMQRERTIVRGEKNRIGKSLYGLILDNPHKGFWGVINPEKMSKQAMRTELSNLGIDPNAVDDLVDRPPKKVINKSTGLVSYEVPQAWKSAPNIFATRINGEDRFMIFNKQDERAMRMVATLKSLDAQQQGEAIKMMGTAGDYYRKSIGGIGTVTRYFAQINTQYNPAFGIYNLMRDIGGAVLNLQTTPLKGQEAKVVSDALVALKAVYQDLRRQRQGLGANSKWASIFEEFESEGGKTGYRDLFETSESRAESLQQELKDFGQGKIRGSGKAVMGWLSDFNDAIENSVRVSVYHNAKQKNLSNAAAASLAKNITVNFNRSGAVSRNFQTLFAFFNASIQGTARIAQTLLTSEGKLSPTGKKIVMGGITLGIIQAALLAMAGLDEDEVPDFVKDKSFVIPYGDGKYFAIPMPLGYNVIPSFGRRVMEFAMSDEKNVGKAVFDTSSMIIDGFNPLGSATFVQTLTPTILDPIVALAENKDFTGKPISRDDINSLSPTPGYTRGSQNSFAITEALAYGINILTGGSEFKKGALSPTPDQIEYLVGEAFGGVGREALKVGRGIESLATGEELATYNVPIVGRLTGNVQQQAAQRGKFFNNIRRLNEHQAEIEGRLLQGDDISDYIDQYPESSLYQAGDKIYNQITKLRRTKKVLEESGAGKDDLKSIDETILSLMSSLNEIYDSARQQ
jgi:hypothetical protein